MSWDTVLIVSALIMMCIGYLLVVEKANETY